MDFYQILACYTNNTNDDEAWIVKVWRRNFSSFCVTVSVVVFVMIFLRALLFYSSVVDSELKALCICFFLAAAAAADAADDAAAAAAADAPITWPNIQSLNLTWLAFNVLLGLLDEKMERGKNTVDRTNDLAIECVQIVEALTYSNWNPLRNSWPVFTFRSIEGCRSSGCKDARIWGH